MNPNEEQSYYPLSHNSKNWRPRQRIMLEKAIYQLYWFLTDFCINMANLLGISYVEFNFLLFIVVPPTALVVLVGLNVRKLMKRLR